MEGAGGLIGWLKEARLDSIGRDGFGTGLDPTIGGTDDITSRVTELVKTDDAAAEDGADRLGGWEDSIGLPEVGVVRLGGGELAGLGAEVRSFVLCTAEDATGATGAEEGRAIDEEGTVVDEGVRSCGGGDRGRTEDGMLNLEAIDGVMASDGWGLGVIATRVEIVTTELC